ncbi:MAG: peptidoglycan hydrolase-like protein with peptidoglycan-binding domain, partial [Myxococcota bacterium]
MLGADVIVEGARMPKTVKVGSRGPDVSELQKLLNSVLRLQPPLATDGACGTGTVAALVKFQKRVGLSGDGVCGARTWEKLKASA